MSFYEGWYFFAVLAFGLVPALILLFIFRKRPHIKPEGGACE